MEKRYSRLGGMLRNNCLGAPRHSSRLNTGRGRNSWSRNGRGDSETAAGKRKIIRYQESFAGRFDSNLARNGGGRNFSCDSDDAEKSNNGRFGEEHF